MKVIIPSLKINVKPARPPLKIDADGWRLENKMSISDGQNFWGKRGVSFRKFW